ncbi:hypothetical protein I8751_01090 [Nostocaceae cyanobacterium CENA357]|uniref:Uncharacterized protein n=1 Tax=Atlanticothrix silvestris CENA357 TaxID=1725252 RepID=A0A8J7KYG5_9CYAN|nr:hypothetical protein [Atlanticothrix silvestris]MBH8551006.1 hypothetical protein [Atlanticothrix silvestris CENA357]
MKKALVSLGLVSTGIWAISSVAALSDRCLIQNHSSNIPPEILKKIFPEENNRLTIFQKRPLTSASEKEIRQAAVNYTLAKSCQFKILSGIPEAIFARPIKVAEIPATGFGEFDFGGKEPPMILVVVKGNFDISGSGSGFPGFQTSNPPRSTKYTAYIFDLQAGTPIFSATGLTGKYFRNALKDSTIPDDLESVDL